MIRQYRYGGRRRTGLRKQEPDHGGVIGAEG